MKEYIELGNSPVFEDCIQVVRDEEYLKEMHKEAVKYKNFLENRYPDFLDYGRFKIKPFNHEFGKYYEVVFEYNFEDEVCEMYAFFIEDTLPKQWNDAEIKSFVKIK